MLRNAKKWHIALAGGVGVGGQNSRWQWQLQHDEAINTLSYTEEEKLA